MAFQLRALRFKLINKRTHHAVCRFSRCQRDFAFNGAFVLVERGEHGLKLRSERGEHTYAVVELSVVAVVVILRERCSAQHKELVGSEEHSLGQALVKVLDLLYHRRAFFCRKGFQRIELFPVFCKSRRNYGNALHRGVVL